MITTIAISNQFDTMFLMDFFVFYSIFIYISEILYHCCCHSADTFLLYIGVYRKEPVYEGY